MKTLLAGSMLILFTTLTASADDCQRNKDYAGQLEAEFEVAGKPSMDEVTAHGWNCDSYSASTLEGFCTVNPSEFKLLLKPVVVTEKYSWLGKVLDASLQGAFQFYAFSQTGTLYQVPFANPIHDINQIEKMNVIKEEYRISQGRLLGLTLSPTSGNKLNVSECKPQ